MSKAKINLQQEEFCQAYALDEECFNNATRSYALAYKYDLDNLSKTDAIWEEITDEKGKVIGKEIVEQSSYDKAYKTCSVAGHKLLRKDSIRERIARIREDYLTDTNVDAELATVIKQNKELTPKINAIKVYNAIKGREVKKHEITGKDGLPITITEMSNEELRKLIEQAKEE